MNTDRGLITRVPWEEKPPAVCEHRPLPTPPRVLAGQRWHRWGHQAGAVAVAGPIPRAHPRAHPQPHPCLQLAAGTRHLRVPHMQVFRRALSTSFSTFHRHTFARFSFDPINYYYRKVVSIRHEIFSFGMILSLQLMLLPSFNISLKSFSMWINIIQMQVICRINSTLHKENY